MSRFFPPPRLPFTSWKIKTPLIFVSGPHLLGCKQGERPDSQEWPGHVHKIQTGKTKPLTLAHTAVYCARDLLIYHSPFTVPHTERTSQQAAFVSWPQRMLVNSKSLLKERTLNKPTRLYQHLEELAILWCGDTVATWFAPLANTTYCTKGQN